LLAEADCPPNPQDSAVGPRARSGALVGSRLVDRGDGSEFLLLIGKALSGKDEFVAQLVVNNCGFSSGGGQVDVAARAHLAAELKLSR